MSLPKCSTLRHQKMAGFKESEVSKLADMLGEQVPDRAQYNPKLRAIQITGTATLSLSLPEFLLAGVGDIRERCCLAHYKVIHLTLVLPTDLVPLVLDALGFPRPLS